MLRRFEMYKMRDGTSAETVAELEEVLRGCGAYIPQVLHSVVGSNLTDANVDMVWEQAYESRETYYEQYMCHPYHICVFDRYLLPEGPVWLRSFSKCQTQIIGCGLVFGCCHIGRTNG